MSDSYFRVKDLGEEEIEDKEQTSTSEEDEKQQDTKYIMQKTTVPGMENYSSVSNLYKQELKLPVIIEPPYPHEIISSDYWGWEDEFALLWIQLDGEHNGEMPRTISEIVQGCQIIRWTRRDKKGSTINLLYFRSLIEAMHYFFVDPLPENCNLGSWKIKNKNLPLSHFKILNSMNEKDIQTITFMDLSFSDKKRMSCNIIKSGKTLELFKKVCENIENSKTDFSEAHTIDDLFRILEISNEIPQQALGNILYLIGFKKFQKRTRIESLGIRKRSMFWELPKKLHPTPKSF